MSSPVMTAQVETWSGALAEMQPLWRDHFSEVYPNQEHVALAPRLDIYAAIERAGQLFVATLREAGSMVGYFVGIVNWSLHCGGCLDCIQDMFYVHPRVRGRLGGLRLFRTVRRELQARGVHRWHVSSIEGHDASRLFRALGMRKNETYYSQWLAP